MSDSAELAPSAPPKPPARVGSLATLPAGSRVGKYEIERTLGQGGFGITYRAHDTQLHRDVALKEYMPAAIALREPDATVLPRSEEVAEAFNHGRERFLEEARTLVRLAGTPGVVGVFDYLEANNTAYMAMTLIDGETLDARLRRERRLPQAEIEKILHPLLDGLEIVHKAGFLHRDVKPANILLDRATGQPTLVDFGASREAISARTSTMTAIHTPGYSAPEQMTSGKQGPWTDIYALAATLYHCAVTRPPPGAIERFTDDTYIPAKEAAKDRYAPTLLAAIDAGLNLRPARRPQSIAEWRRVLDGSAPPPAAEPSDATLAMDAITAPSAGKNRLGAAAMARRGLPSLRWIAAGLAALAIAAGGAWMVLRPAPETAEQTVLRLEEEARRLTGMATKLRQEEEARQQAAADARRKADEEVARRAEEEKVATETAARQQTHEAERQRAAAAEAKRKAEEEAARRAAEEKAATEAVARRKAEEEAAVRAEAEAARRRAEEQERVAAEVKRKAEEDAARKAAEEKTTREKAEAEAKRKAEAEARAAAEEKAKADAEAKRQGEAAETALRLSEADRKRIQVALTSLGHNTQGSDGVFGARTRQMIAAWQKSQSAPETGYLTMTQLAALQQQARPALARYDEEQKNIEDDKRKAEDDAKRKQEEEAKRRAEEEGRVQPPTAPPPGTTTAPSTATPAHRYDGSWSGTLACSRIGPDRSLTVQVAAGAGRVAFTSVAGSGEVTLRITGNNVIGEVSWLGQVATLRGTVSDQQLRAEGTTRAATAGSSNYHCSLRLDRQPASATTTPATGVDGLWSGTLKCDGQPQWTLSVQLAGGAGRTSFSAIHAPGSLSLQVRDGGVTAEVQYAGNRGTLHGNMSGERMTAAGNVKTSAGAGAFWCALTFDRQPASATTTPAIGVDGRWEGALSCPISVQATINEPVSLNIGTGRSTYRRDSLEVTVELRGDNVLATMSIVTADGVSWQGELRGRVSGTTIETVGYNIRGRGIIAGAHPGSATRTCTLRLTKQ